MCYVEGYIKEIKIEKVAGKGLIAKFTFLSDWKGKDSKLLYGVLDSNDTSGEIKGYGIYEPTDVFYIQKCAYYFINKTPSHLGVYFESKCEEAEKQEENQNISGYKVTAYRFIYDY